ncbi:hypothetical protein O9X94_22675 [Agrobacterium leguminum]|uniref:Uncharacterized protein n=1 Tax=Agrobacterium leguminum TaxID=2792015 RepID=A0A9X3KI56_9HYPH|nr:hypothetical protein [Agrobacterium leguminum]MCZ7912138.1 hypothetical protein [Agrobacterium leguminum]UXT41238.1 hypothetical protein FY137_08595 [Agrobacterium tumefaciens]
MKPTDRNRSASHRSNISSSAQAALSEIFNAAADGVAFAPARIAQALGDTHLQALSQLVQRIESGEITEEDLQVLWQAHHASDRFYLTAPIADLLLQISRCLPGR